MSESKAATTRTVLLTVLVLVVTALTGASLLIVWHRMRQQVTADFTLGLRTSVLAFQHAEEERLSGLQREDDLLADLPSLKALMTTNDDRTIQDGATEFWRTSGRDLFALVDPHSRVRAVYAKGLPGESRLRQDLGEALPAPAHEYLLTSGHLFRYVVAPVYFGDAVSGTLLGYVVSGYAVDTASLVERSEQVEALGIVVSGGDVIAGSETLLDTNSSGVLGAISTHEAQPLVFGKKRYLGLRQDLSGRASVPLSLVLLKSLSAPEREIHEISQLLLLVGICTVLLGSGLMLLVAEWLTRPLEELTRRVRAYGSGEAHSLGSREGTQEVRQLASDFGAMQERIDQSNRLRLASERLATIGSMASSVSHDLRHYLASIYANAEFLAAADSTEEDRAEFLEDIRIAVLGTTEMLESLMIFGRTGAAVQHAPELLDALLRRAVAQVRTHPDASGVKISVHSQSSEAAVTADGRQLERALYNLLLNACQAARTMRDQAKVSVSLSCQATSVAIRVTDNGMGVPDGVRKTLFEPFVSEGKQHGTGLGLTLCRCIAEEHGGSVSLIESSSEGTTFQIVLPLIGSEVGMLLVRGVEA